MRSLFLLAALATLAPRANPSDWKEIRQRAEKLFALVGFHAGAVVAHEKYRPALVGAAAHVHLRVGVGPAGTRRALDEVAQQRREQPPVAFGVHPGIDAELRVAKVMFLAEAPDFLARQRRKIHWRALQRRQAVPAEFLERVDHGLDAPEFPLQRGFGLFVRAGDGLPQHPQRSRDVLRHDVVEQVDVAPGARHFEVAEPAAFGEFIVQLLQLGVRGLQLSLRRLRLLHGEPALLGLGDHARGFALDAPVVDHADGQRADAGEDHAEEEIEIGSPGGEHRGAAEVAALFRDVHDDQHGDRHREFERRDAEAEEQGRVEHQREVDVGRRAVHAVAGIEAVDGDGEPQDADQQRRGHVAPADLRQREAQRRAEADRAGRAQLRPGQAAAQEPVDHCDDRQRDPGECDDRLVDQGVAAPEGERRNFARDFARKVRGLLDFGCRRHVPMIGPDLSTIARD